MIRCWFHEIDAKKTPFGREDMDHVPPIGSMIFVEDSEVGYRVLDVQYQMRKPPLIQDSQRNLLILVNIIIKEIAR